MDSFTEIDLPGLPVGVTMDCFTEGHPLGVTMVYFTEIKKGKVAYAIVLTIREHVEVKGDSEKTISTFKTRELLLSGVTRPDEHVKAKIDSQTTLTLSFEIMPSEK
jgi:hypothetical protein